MKKINCFTIALVVLGGLIVGSQAGAQEFTFRMHTFLPPVSNPAKHFLEPWAKKIEKDSKGRIKVQNFWAMQLGGKPPQLVDQVREGVVDIIWTLPGFTPGRFPRIEVFELPFVHKDTISTNLALQDYQDKHLQGELKDFKVLLAHVHAGYLFMTKKPVRRMRDLKGMKLRAPSRTGVWLLSALGASAVGAPLPRIPPMLSKGVINGVMLPYEIAPAVKMQELVSNFSILSGDQPRLSAGVFLFMMNKKSYNSLPPDLKKVIDDNSGRNIARQAGEIWANIEIPGEKVMHSKSKNKFYTISKAETKKIRKAAQPVFKRWFEEIARIGADGPALLKDARAFIEKYRK